MLKADGRFINNELLSNIKVTIPYGNKKYRESYNWLINIQNP